MNTRALMLVGSYTKQEGSRGITTLAVDETTGKLSEVSSIDVVPNPSFVIHQGNIVLAAVEEADEASIAAFRFQRSDGTLSFLNRVSYEGAGTCHVAFSPDGKFVFGANYNSGSIWGCQILPDGRLGEVTAFIQHIGKSVHEKRQEGPHAHFVGFASDKKTLMAVDLGCDKIFRYSMKKDGSLVVDAKMPWIRMPPGDGPRHFVYAENGKDLYVITELKCRVLHYTVSSDNEFCLQDTHCTIPDSMQGFCLGAHIALAPDEKHLYVSIRTANTIAVFERDEITGNLSLISVCPSGCKIPRAFAISLDGKWLLAAGEDSGNIAVWRMDPVRGILAEQVDDYPIGAPSVIDFL